MICLSEPFGLGGKLTTWWQVLKTASRLGTSAGSPTACPSPGAFWKLPAQLSCLFSSWLWLL